MKATDVILCLLDGVLVVAVPVGWPEIARAFVFDYERL